MTQPDHLHTDPQTAETNRHSFKASGVNAFIVCQTPFVLAAAVSSPDIQRDRHHGVEDDDVRPEGEKGIEQKVVHRGVPGQVALKQRPHLSLPYCIAHSQDHTHTHQEAKDLMETQMEEQ